MIGKIDWNFWIKRLKISLDEVRRVNIEKKKFFTKKRVKIFSLILSSILKKKDGFQRLKNFQIVSLQFYGVFQPIKNIKKFLAIWKDRRSQQSRLKIETYDPDILFSVIFQKFPPKTFLFNVLFFWKRRDSSFKKSYSKRNWIKKKIRWSTRSLPLFEKRKFFFESSENFFKIFQMNFFFQKMNEKMSQDLVLAP